MKAILWICVGLLGTGRAAAQEDEAHGGFVLEQTLVPDGAGQEVPDGPYVATHPDGRKVEVRSVQGPRRAGITQVQGLVRRRPADTLRREPAEPRRQTKCLRAQAKDSTRWGGGRAGERGSGS